MRMESIRPKVMIDAKYLKELIITKCLYIIV